MSGSHRHWPSLILLTLIMSFVVPSHIYAQTAVGAIGVYYAGPEDAVAAAIDLATPYLVRVNQPDLAQVIVINNAPLKETLQVFSQEIRQGRVGLVLFCGPLFPQGPSDLRALLGFSAFGIGRTADPASIQTTGTTDPLQRAITWRSAPEIRARTLITNPNLLQPLIVTSAQEGVIQRVRGREQTQALIVDGWLNHPSNEVWRQWPYFNYLIYRLIADAAGEGHILSYADYPPAPTPQRETRWVIVGVGVSIVLGSATLYYIARRQLFLRSHPSGPSLKPSADPAWHTVGFHRPLAGFLTFMPWGLVLFIPIFNYEHHLLPDVLIPDPWGIRIWTMIGRWVILAWILVDAGTGTAAVRHFSARHHRAPQYATHYVQFHVWWQFLSGAVQFGVICFLAATVFPRLGLAHLTYYLLARAILRFPGISQVFNLTFRARQRFDLEQFLNLFYRIAVIALQPVLILLFRQWGESNPEVGAGIAGALGLAGGIYFGGALTLLVGAGFHLRDGQSLASVFAPSFNGRIAREVLSFGFPWAFAFAVPAIGAIIQVSLFGDRWTIMALLMAGYEILLTSLYTDLMPALAEAAAVGYKTLLRYYVSQGIRYGVWFSLFLFSALGALAGNALGALPGMPSVKAAQWLPLLLAWGALRWAAWLPDRMLEAAGRPGWIMLLNLVEQGIRIGGLATLSGRWGTQAIISVYVVSLLTRILLARILAGRYLVHARIYIWQTLIAPAAGALLLYYLLRYLNPLVENATQAANLWPVVALLLLSSLFYACLTALLGGWDNGSIDELSKAVKLSGIGFPFAWLFLQSVRVGARISPLHGRFPIRCYEMAQKEAHALSFAQIPLVEADER